MIRLTYTSRATETVTPSTVLDILEAARSNNAPHGVTGLLYYAQGQFAQCLEGEEAAVEAVYQKIAADQRHREIEVMRTTIDTRAFTDWSMAFVDTSTAEVARLLVENHINSYEPTKWPAPTVAPLLAAFGNSLRAERIPVTY